MSTSESPAPNRLLRSAREHRPITRAAQKYGWMPLAVRDGTLSDPEAAGRTINKLRSPGGTLCVAERGLRTHGFALAVDRSPAGGIRTAHLTLLAVDPASQSRGLGRSLLATITHAIEAEGFVEATLSVLEDNPGARKIYENAGWSITGRSVFEDSGRPCVRYSLKFSLPVTPA